MTDSVPTDPADRFSLVVGGPFNDLLRRLANQHHLAFHRKWVGEMRSGDELMGTPDPSSASDLNATVDAVLQLRFIPVDFPAVLQLVIAAGVPLLAVVITLIPLGNLVKWVVGTQL